MNLLAAYAAKEGRGYVTPEDVTAALEAGQDATTVRLHLLEILGKQTTFGCEDPGLCAFIAWKGHRS